MKIEFKNVTKQYKRNFYGIKNADLTVDGGVFGLLGRNGAGKTTLMRMLATIITPTDGKILFDGKDLRNHSSELRSKLGYLPQNSKLQPTLNVYEFLDYIAVLKEIKGGNKRKAEIERCLEVVGLQDEKKKKLGAFSGGMLRRAGIAQAILGDPELIIVDEPTTGLDPEERLYFRNFISKIALNKTIILSTHIISDVENICQNVGILDSGNVIYNGSINTLDTIIRDKVWQCEVLTAEADGIRQKATVTSITYTPTVSKVRYISEESIYPGSEKMAATLEDAYIYAVGGIKR